MHTRIPYRGIVAITGPDRLAFLQGMLTQDLRLLETQPAVYTLQLNRMGRILGDAWIVVKDDNTWWMDTENPTEVVADLTAKRLRYKVQLEVVDINVWAWWGEDQPPFGAMRDTRHPNMGWRAYGEFKAEDAANIDQYRRHTLSLGVPDGSLDFEMGRAMPLPWGCEHAIGWDKGCYIGQEPVARSRYQGVVRQHIVPVTFQKNGPWSMDQENNLIDPSGTNQGRLVSRFENCGLGLVSTNVTEKTLIINL